MPFIPSGGGGGASDESAIHDDVADEIHQVTAKATPVDADVLLIEDSAASWAKKRVTIGSLPSGGGGAGDGVGYLIEPGLKPPDSAHASDEEFDTANGGDDSDTGFSWVNQGTSTFAINYGTGALTVPASSTDSIRALVKSAPSTPWTVTTRVTAVAPFTNFTVAGLCCRESSSGELYICSIQYNGSGTFVEGARFNSPTSFNAGVGTYGDSTDKMARLSPTWLRLGDNGTNVTWSFSNNGLDWYQFASQGRTAFMAGGPDQVGIFLNDLTNQGRTARFDFFRVNWTPDFDPTA